VNDDAQQFQTAVVSELPGVQTAVNDDAQQFQTEVFSDAQQF